MTQKIPTTGVLSLFVIVFIVQSQLTPATGDLRVIDKWSNQVVFQTASDFVRTGCGSFTNRSSLIVSEPLDACEVPAAPPTSWFSQDNEAESNQWVLLATGEGGCDLRTKFRNAASAGYSAIIVGTDEQHEDVVKPGVVYEDDEEFIDVHLVNSWDIPVLSKQFSYPKEFTVCPPSLSRCKEEYHRTWLRSRYISGVRRVWKKCMEICWECAKWILFVMGKLTIGIKSIMPSFFHHSRDTFSSIAISLASIVFAITVMMIISIQNTARKLTQYKSNQQEQPPDFSKTSKHNVRDDKSERFDGNSSSSESSSPPPRRPNYHQSSPKPAITKDYTIYHRINLDIKLTEILTRSRVNNAYRDMALKYHPDKNRHLNEDELQKITDEFRRKKKSRDILLQYCTY